MSAIWGKADMTRTGRYVRFSNRPFGDKSRQTIHHCSVDVAHGLVLLFGIGAKALPSWDSKTRWNNLMGGLGVKLNGRSKRTYDLTSCAVPRGLSFHRSVELEFSPIASDPGRSHAAEFCRGGAMPLTHPSWARPTEAPRPIRPG